MYIADTHSGALTHLTEDHERTLCGSVVAMTLINATNGQYVTVADCWLNDPNLCKNCRREYEKAEGALKQQTL